VSASAPHEVDVEGLAEDLRALPDIEVHFDAGSRALYATDASNYRQVPLGVVVPRTVEAIPAVLAVCRKHRAPVTSRGGGTSLAGQTCNVAVILDTSKHLRRIVSIDPHERTAVVEPGVVLDQLREAAGRYGLTFAPDPSTHDHNTLGGMLGNNSCGVHSMIAGRTSDNTIELEVITYDGLRLTVGATDEATYHRILEEGGPRATLYRGLRELADEHAEEIRQRFPDIPRRISGYNLPDLLPENGFQVARALVGTEGTCVVILHAKLRLVPDPPRRAVVILGFPDIYRAADAVPELLVRKPIGFEAIDHHLTENMEVFRQHAQDIGRLPEGKAWLFLEFGAETHEEVVSQAEATRKAFAERLGPSSVTVVTDPEVRHRLQKLRESGLAVTAQEPDGRRGWPGWEDSSVHPRVLGAYLRDLKRLFEQFGLDAALYGHFGQGCVHCRITFDLESEHGLRQFPEFMEAAARLVVRHGGSLSGEHGDGQARGPYLEIMYGPRLVEAFRRFKRLWDPEGRMNPGQKIDADGVTEHLRLADSYRPRPIATAFAYPEDGGDFNRVALRCVGIGECRRLDSGVMCPSYMGTLDEKYSTRGRARLLYEMSQGAAVPEGWKSDYVRDALDWCLSCKGCKTGCPVRVDMATYKAEFLDHHYRGRLRPRHAYALGLSYRWLPWGARMPGLVNSLAGGRWTGRLLKSLGGIAPARPMPKIAPTSYRRSRRSLLRSPPPIGPETVVLWTDTWNDHLHPEILGAAERVLSAAGFSVRLPRRRLCCGRPLYDFGMLGRARSLLSELLDTLEEEIAAGAPVVVLEPSCQTVFRDELPRLFRGDPRAEKLAASAVSLPQLLLERHRTIPKLPGSFLVQPHCHERSSLDLTKPLTELYSQMGAEAEILDAGCCGMAGSFGMEAEKYPVSVKIAERKLLPAVRARDARTEVVADGFSCREQINDLAGTYPRHVAQVLEAAYARRPPGPAPAARGA
jgi:FAD/FMN-containing dehydrogenase/Fe-S oxidoreductase